jgi:hypothetical protein
MRQLKTTPAMAACLLAWLACASAAAADGALPDNGKIKPPPPPPPPKSLAIEVISASYGHGGSLSNCVVTPSLKATCNGRSRCVVDVSDELCAPPSTLPGGLILTLTVEYKCTPLVAARTVHADKPFRIVLNCGASTP